MKRLALIAALIPATAQAQYYPPQPYAPPAQYKPPVSQVRPWLPPALPPGSPSLMIPNPTIQPLPPYQPWTGARP